MGYRAYKKLQIKPLFDFGYGLSYTSFEYSDFKIKNDSKKQLIKVDLKVTNTGQYMGKEIVQIYVTKEDSLIYRPISESQAFDKLTLQPEDTIPL